MAIVTWDFSAAESGGLEGINAWTDTTVVTTPAPPTTKQFFCYKIANFGPGFINTKFEDNSKVWKTVGFFVRWNTLGVATTESDFCKVVSTGGSLLQIRLAWTKTGDLKVYNQSGSLISTVTGVFFANVWYRIEFKYSSAASGQPLKLWIDDVLKVDLTGQNFATSNSMRLQFDNKSNQGDALNVYVGGYYFRTDDGAAIDTNDTRLGDFSILKYQNTNQDATSDFGSNLSLGRWDNSADNPANDSTKSQHDTSGGTLVKRGITVDSAGGGPFGDSNVDGTIIAAKAVFRVRQKPSVPTASTVWGLYGSTLHTDIGTDHVTNFLIGTPGTTYVNAYIVFDDPLAATGAMPTETDYFQVGLRVRRVGSFGTGSTELGDYWCSILHQEPVPASNMLDFERFPRGVSRGVGRGR